MVKPEWSGDWPNLNAHNARITSPETPDYNCLAFSAGRLDQWWEPYVIPPKEPGKYWLDGVHPDNTPEDWTAVLATVGFEPCKDSCLEPGWVKVALYAKSSSVTHAARQLRDGRWTSKLGVFEDIEHDDLSVLEGALYGTVRLFLRRPRRDEDP